VGGGTSLDKLNMKINNFFKVGAGFMLFVMIFSILCCLLVNIAKADDQNNTVPSENTLPSVSPSDGVYVNLDELNPNNIETFNETHESNLSSTIESNQSEVTENVTPINVSDELNIAEKSISDANINDVQRDEGRDGAYQYINLEAIENKSSIEQNDSQVNEDMVDYVLYKENKKEIETKTTEGSNLIINVNDVTVSNNNWKKEVSVSSNKHRPLPVTVYSDVPIKEGSKVRVFWKETKTVLPYEDLGPNSDNITERISWIVPHLSTQSFDITSVSDNSTNSTTGTITVTPVNYLANLSSSSANLSFIVNDTLGNVPYCNLSLFKSGAIVTIALFNSLNPSYNFSVGNGIYTWSMDCNDNVNNITNSSLGIFTVAIPASMQINFTSNVSQVNNDSMVSFLINISAPTSPIQYTIDWGDGSSPVNSGAVNVSSLYYTLNHVYHSTGKYSVLLTVNSNSTYTRTLSITVNSVSSGTDNSGPQISLLAPADNKIISDNQINFSYTSVDNVYVSNCTLSIYFYANNSLLGVSVYSNLNTDSNNKTTNTSLTDFDEGSYSWDVGCYDNSSNYEEENRNFEVSHGSNYISATQTQESLNLSAGDLIILNNIDDLISKASAFITKEDSYGAKEKEVITDLKLDDTVVNYKKILMQMKQDISYNLGFMQDESLRQSRRQQIQDQITEMQTEIPLDISVEDSYDYYKTESKPVIEDIMKNYSALEREDVNSLDFNALSDSLSSLQEGAIISTNAKSVKITYSDRSDEITLIRKSIEIKNNSFDSFVEYIPISISSSPITFVTNSNSLGSQYFQVQLKDISDSKIVYYIKDTINLKDIEGTSTVLLSSSIQPSKLSGITGFVTLFQSGNRGDLGVYAIWFVLASLILVGGTYSMKKYTISRIMSNDENFRDVILKIKDADVAIKNKDFDSAKNCYREIKDKYMRLPENAKTLSYNKIRLLQIKLDRKEAISLVKEFTQAAKENRKDDALLIYSKIKSIYPRLLEKDRQRLYEKVNPILNTLNRRN
jgi:tetratricopeptide (TPR) repeat protein